MRSILLFGLILLPFAEIWGYFKFGSLYGWWFLIYLIVMAVLGWRLIQEEKDKTYTLTYEIGFFSAQKVGD